MSTRSNGVTNYSFELTATTDGMNVHIELEDERMKEPLVSDYVIMATAIEPRQSMLIADSMIAGLIEDRKSVV